MCRGSGSASGGGMKEQGEAGNIDGGCKKRGAVGEVVKEKSGGERGQMD